MTLLLALDSACASCSAALWHDNRVLAHKFEHMPRGQAEKLMPFVAEVMQQSATAFSDLDALAVTIGPGAFTGIRICLAAARGLALALKKPLIGVTTMEAIFAAQDLSGFKGPLVAVVIETRRMDYYLQLFDNQGTKINEAEALPASIIAEKFKSFAGKGSIFLCGDGATRLQQEAVMQDFGFAIGAAENQPDAGVFGGVALEKFRSFEADHFDVAPVPLYLRPPDTNPPKPKFLYERAGP